MMMMMMIDDDDNVGNESQLEPNRLLLIASSPNVLEKTGAILTMVM